MKILVTNDDGYTSKNLAILVDVAKRYGEVVVVAPLEEQSAKSHALNIRTSFSFKAQNDLFEGVKTYVIDSTPADCVRVAYYYLKEDFDLVLSGINKGYNTGEDILYSGTVGAATEAVLHNKKAIAISCKRSDEDHIKEKAIKALDYIFSNNFLTIHPLYNVNIPPVSKGFKITKPGKTNFDSSYYFENDTLKPLGKGHFELEKDSLTDVYSVEAGYTSITPLNYERVEKEILNKLIK